MTTNANKKKNGRKQTSSISEWNEGKRKGIKISLGKNVRKHSHVRSVLLNDSKKKRVELTVETKEHEDVFKFQVKATRYCVESYVPKTCIIIG